MTLREYLLEKYHAEAAWPTLEDSELWEAAKTDMREEAAHVANEWVVACDHAGEIQRAIETLPIE